MAVFSLEAPVSEGHCTNPAVTTKYGQAVLIHKDKEHQQPECITLGMENTCSAKLNKEHRSTTKEGAAVGVVERTSQALIVAIAGHDPAVLEIWDMQVTLPSIRTCTDTCLLINAPDNSGQYTVVRLDDSHCRLPSYPVYQQNDQV